MHNIAPLFGNSDHPNTTSHALRILDPGKEDSATPENPGLNHSPSADNISVSRVMVIYHINDRI